ncbi:uncharacterized protein LOC122388814 [Amphibalanus amphitrite]|uniref:uncharacterized protein LOC122388814 n=1 Tax=Amphibalanus amphitrite TaxID=1232801 RepID=UPI001C91979A|nr:uncharacterized protein LOC122388814 [Amphibalanus amphitrite]
MAPPLALGVFLVATLAARTPPVAATGENFNCSGNVCDPVITPCCDDPDNGCPGDECSASQLRVVSPYSQCGCCHSCIDYLAAGDACATSNVYHIGQLPSQICGPGLRCTRNDTGAYCAAIADTECAAARQAFAEAEKTILNPGQLDPACDSEGAYRAAQAMPGLTTSCYSKTGERLYGESGTTQAGDMGCLCSRLHQGELSVEGLQPRPHCLTNGNFDPLQCSNRTCFCVDKTNGTILSVIADRHFLDLLPCFNSSLHRSDYLKPCELAAERLANETAEWAAQGFTPLGLDPPRCDIGGYFDKVQETRTERYCVAPDGTDLGYRVPRRSDAADTTCNCARSSYHMQMAGQRTDLPQCCENGAFRAYQCRGLYCYCVDEHGQQTDDPAGAVTQNSISQLGCFNVTCPTTSENARPEQGYLLSYY